MKHNQVRVMWAWHPEDPFSADSYFKHAGNSRGHMMQDVSFRNPASNEHYHQQLYSAATSVTNPVFSNLLAAVWLIVIYTFAHL